MTNTNDATGPFQMSKYHVFVACSNHLILMDQTVSFVYLALRAGSQIFLTRRCRVGPARCRADMPNLMV